MTTETLARPVTQRAFSLSEAAQFWISTVKAALEAEGIFATVSNDLHGWKAFMESRPDRAGLMPVLNPDVHDIPDFSSFYLNLHDEDGTTLAVIGCRDLGYVGNLDAWQQDGATWGQDGQLKAHPVPPHLKAGRFIYRGGLFVPPEVRKRGLARVVTSFMRALIVKHFPDASTMISHCTESTFLKGLPIRVYGYSAAYKQFEPETCFASVDRQALYLLEAPIDRAAEETMREANRFRLDQTNDLVGILRVLRGDTD